MQQTTKYQLNLIETTDTFSPAALNENMEKVEAALDTKADAAQTAAVTEALDQRLQVFEAKRLSIGFYKLKSSTIDVDLGFTPACVMILDTAPTGKSGILTPEMGSSHGKIIPNGFHVETGLPTFTAIGNSDTTYGYVAFG